MNGWIKKAMAAVLTGTIALSGAPATAWAIDANSQFASTGGASSTGIGEFYLIKDYDSVHDTKNNINSIQGAPYSSSPAETFVYTITPYYVWNAGNTTSTGTVPIDSTNMPMLEASTQTQTGVSYDTTNSRELIVKQSVGKDAALKETTDSYAHDAYKAAIKLPNYTTVGDYWYMVVESQGENGDNPTTGVFYGTNDIHTTSNTQKNGSHTATYYIHVQVTEISDTSSSPTGTPSLIKNVTLHKNAPEKTMTNTAYNSNNNTATLYSANKTNAIENRYYAGQLKVAKVVTGNAGDKNQYFEIRVTFTKPAGTVINSDIAISGAYYQSGDGYQTNDNQTIPGQYDNNTVPASDALFKWDKQANDTREAKAIAKFYVKDGSTVSFSNIPLGINYTVEEHEIVNSGYANTFEMQRGDDELTLQFNGSNPSLKTDTALSGQHFYSDSGENATNIGAEGSIAGANADIVTITNSKAMTVDIGVVTKNAPYIAMLAVAGVAVALMVARKKTVIED